MFNLLRNRSFILGLMGLLVNTVHTAKLIEKAEDEAILCQPDNCPDSTLYPDLIEDASPEDDVLNLQSLSGEIEDQYSAKNWKPYVMQEKNLNLKSYRRQGLLKTPKKHQSKYYIMTPIEPQKFSSEDVPTSMSTPLSIRKRVPRFAESFRNKRRINQHSNNQNYGTNALNILQRQKRRKLPHKQRSQSIFSQVPKFTLPNSSNKIQQESTGHLSPENKVKSVEDTSVERHLPPHVTKNIYRRKEEPSVDLPEDVEMDQRENSDLPSEAGQKQEYENEYLAELGYDNAKPTKAEYIGLKQRLNGKNQYKEDEVDNIEHGSDKKIITLLNNLEQEIKNKRLDSIEKQYVNKKIKNIYGKICSQHHELEELDKRVKHRLGQIRKLDIEDTNSQEVDKVVKKEENAKTGILEGRRRSIKHHITTHYNKRPAAESTTNHKYLVFKEEYDLPHVSANFEENVYDADETERPDTDYDFSIDPLGLNRRQYYQNKIDRLKRRLREVQKLHDHVHSKSFRRVHHIRPVESDSPEYNELNRRRFLEPF